MKHCVCWNVDNYSTGTPCSRQSADKDCRMIQSVGTGKHGGSVVVCFLSDCSRLRGALFWRFRRPNRKRWSFGFVCMCPCWLTVGAAGAIVVGASNETVNGGGRTLPSSPPAAPSPPPGLIHRPLIGCCRLLRDCSLGACMLLRRLYVTEGRILRRIRAASMCLTWPD